jgi:uncharacterized protein YkwD
VARRWSAGLIGLATCLLLVGLAAVPRADAAAYGRFYANFAGEELMRAINADRRALGRSALHADADLISLARDRPVKCPAKASLVIHGRARDMAERGYFDHVIPGCPDPADGTFDAFDLLAAAGYKAGVQGENIATNNYPSSARTYATGCSLGGSGCHGSITGVPWTVAVAERGWMGSSVHRDLVLSTTFTRFGCGAWSSSAGDHLYACYFVSSGSGRLDGSGPVIDASGAATVIAKGATATFTASFGDARSALSDGFVALDGTHLRNWAYDHVGSDAATSVTTPPLTPGTHTLTWWVRDVATNTSRSIISFTVRGAAASPEPPLPTRTPGPGRPPPATLTPGALASPAAARASPPASPFVGSSIPAGPLLGHSAITGRALAPGASPTRRQAPPVAVLSGAPAGGGWAAVLVPIAALALVVVGGLLATRRGHPRDGP